MFGSGPVEYLFSSDWKARETAITHISREVISFLMPQLTLKFHPRADGGQAKFGEVQEMCMQTVTYACNDSVIKVFMAGLVSVCVCVCVCVFKPCPLSPLTGTDARHSRLFC